jgi:hypothetical protein
MRRGDQVIFTKRPVDPMAEFFASMMGVKIK